MSACHQFMIGGLLSMLFVVGCSGESSLELTPDVQLVQVQTASEQLKSLAPRKDQQVFLTWKDGPPMVMGFRAEDRALARYRPEGAVLEFFTPAWRLAFDPHALKLTELEPSVRQSAKRDAEPEAASRGDLDFALTWQVGDANYQIRMRDPSKTSAIPGKEALYFPVRIVESGNWFQHVAIHDLEAVDADGTVVNEDAGYLELRAWSDRLTFEWHFSDAFSAGGLPTMKFSASSQKFSADTTQTGGKKCLLSLAYLDNRWIQAPAFEPEVSIESPEGAVVGIPDLASQSWMVKMPEIRDWPRQQKGAFPPSALERRTDQPLIIHNRSDQEQEIRLRVRHPRHPITGFVPQLLFGRGGIPTGFPIQISKNWHKKKGQRIPYDGQWAVGSLRLTLPPGSQTPLTYQIIHAQNEGVPIASVAQLSLIGWGYNGFWTQLALGSWGESICFQPGRVMRRALVTDIRPFMVKGVRKGQTYDWASNVGGGDVMALHGEEGQFIPWLQPVTQYLMPGPNMAAVRFNEVLKGGAAHLSTQAMLPRSRDFLRTYFHIRLDVKKKLPVEQLAVFELGTVYYNSGHSKAVFWGQGSGKNGETVVPLEAPVELSSFQNEEQPAWIVMQSGSKDPKARNGFGTRGLIIRGWEARLGGKENAKPWLQAFAAGKQKDELRAALVANPEVKELLPGDFVDCYLEVVVIPPVADAYYGPDLAFQQRLATRQNEWTEVAYEAVNNRPSVSIGGKNLTWPLRVSADGQMQEFTLSGGAGLVPLEIIGLPVYGWNIEEKTPEGWVALGSKFPEEGTKQVAFCLKERTWSALFNLRSAPTNGGSHSRVFRINPKASQPTES